MSSVLKKLIFALVLALGLRACVFETFTVTGTAMAPAVFPGDTVIASKIDYGLRVPGSGAMLIQWGDFKRGDLVILSNVGDPPMTLIRRIVGIPGEEDLVEEGLVGRRPLGSKEAEKVPFSEFPCTKSDDNGIYCYQQMPGRMFLVRGIEKNDQGEVDSSIYPSWKGSAKLDEEHVYVASDDRRDGQDSRRFGPVHINKIVGKVSRLWIPARDLSKVEVNERLKALAKDRRYLGRL